MARMVRAYLGLGSNMGDRSVYLRNAVSLIANFDGVEVKKVSSVYETEPIGGIEQPSFYNMVIEVETDMSPRQLLALVGWVEHMLKRERTTHWGPRTIDVDILLYGEERVNEVDIVIPHPEMLNRAFVLVPLAEIAPDLIIEGETLTCRIERVADQGISKIGSLT